MNNSENVYQIQVKLFKNQLDSENGSYYARVKALNSLNIKQVCQQAVTRGGINMSALNMEQAVEGFLREMCYKLASGISINTGYFIATPSIKGTFDSVNDTYDKGRHTLKVNLIQGDKLRNELENANVSVVGFSSNEHFIDSVYDYATKSKNGVITPGDVVKIVGKKIRIDGSDEAVGLYFNNVETGEVTKVPVDKVYENKPKSLMVRVPELSKGNYTLEIKTQHLASNVTTKSLTVIECPILLVVE